MLTTQPHKYDYFKDDLHFREGWQTAVDVLGLRAAWLAQRIVALTVKPEGILSRKAHSCLDFMIANSFRPIHAERFSFNRLMTRELWRYQWNIATPDRLDLADRINDQAQALIIFFIECTTPARIPASSRLVPLKGLGSPGERDVTPLRSLLGSPNRLLVVVHSPDEPIDVVRELAVVFGREKLESVYRRLMANADLDATSARDEIAQDIEYLYGRHEARTLCVEDAVAATLDRLGQAGRAGADEARLAASRARRAVVAARSGEACLSWRQWSADLAICGMTARSWEPLVTASHYIQYDVPGINCLVGRSGRQKWAAGEGHMIDGDRVPSCRTRVESAGDTSRA